MKQNSNSPRQVSANPNVGPSNQTSKQVLNSPYGGISETTRAKYSFKRTYETNKDGVINPVPTAQVAVDYIAAFPVKPKQSRTGSSG